jgi:hypothetical protein
MWNGYLEFFAKVASGDWSAWMTQHNEHRILIARLFFLGGWYSTISGQRVVLNCCQLHVDESCLHDFFCNYGEKLQHPPIHIGSNVFSLP